ncbi:MAG TPA: pitrilysin family protein [Candidatus Limnocylindria bacterium]|nr:pitrilysin family protein [Candidatus Limnocylindria bacterium]
MTRNVIGAALLALVLPAAGAGTDPVPALANLRLVTLDNGLRVLLAPDSLAGSVDVAIWYRAAERPGQTGITHLFEHLMFDGSARFGPQEHKRRIEAEGGSSGAFTTNDAVCFHQTLPSGSWPLAFELEAERMSSLALTEAKLDQEKRRARAEARERTPFARGLQRLYGLAFRSQPYRWPVFGLDQDLDRITLAGARDHYRARFTPHHATVSVVGRFEPEPVLSALRKAFSSGASRPGAAPRQTSPSEPPQTEPRRASEPSDLPYPLLLLGWRGPAGADPDTPVMALLSMILSNGASSRLGRELVDKRMALYAGGGHEPQRGGSLFYVTVALRPQSDSAAVEQAVLAQVERLAREPVSEDELARARRQAEFGLVTSLQTPRSRAQVLGTTLILGDDPNQVARDLERLRTASAADVQRAAARYLMPAARSAVWMPAAGGTRP